MTSRSDIRPNENGWRRLSYTWRCGWVDWGHALPSGPDKLKQQIYFEKPLKNLKSLEGVDITLNGRPAYFLEYGQYMESLWIKVGASKLFIVEKNLSIELKKSVALGIFLHISHEFESLQSRPPFVWRTDSGYSLEDLVSNIIGFYSAFNGISQDKMREICRETSVEVSEEIWDEFTPNGLGAIKNKQPLPLLFKYEGDTSFPPELQTITPCTKGVRWAVVDGSLSNIINLSCKIKKLSALNLNSNGNIENVR